MVSSGPTIPDSSLPSDALAVLVKYDLRVLRCSPPFD